MRLATLRPSAGGSERLAFADDENSCYPVTEVAEALGAEVDAGLLDPRENAWLTPEGLGLLAQLDAGHTDLDLSPADLGAWRLGPPVPCPGKIVAVGRNYMDHVREGQEIWKKRGKTVEIPKFPSAFAKFPSSLTGPRDEIPLPEGLDDVDYEIELAVVIGSPALNVAKEDALGHVAGYAICNDVAARGIQRREMEAQIGITLAKNFPGFAPLGPWLTTADVVDDPQNLRVTLEVDGEVRQDANTSDMMFSVAELIAYWSPMGLEPGDILITGTPSGVALAREEPDKYYLRSGQLVTARIEGLGELRNPVR
ncbi:MAG: fumarylacetoacetate hydrolase family protein [Rhodovibrionaceae bacterium]